MADLVKFFCNPVVPVSRNNFSSYTLYSNRRHSSTRATFLLAFSFFFIFFPSLSRILSTYHRQFIPGIVRTLIISLEIHFSRFQATLIVFDLVLVLILAFKYFIFEARFKSCANFENSPSNVAKLARVIGNIGEYYFSRSREPVWSTLKFASLEVLPVSKCLPRHTLRRYIRRDYFRGPVRFTSRPWDQLTNRGRSANTIRNGPCWHEGGILRNASKYHDIGSPILSPCDLL